MIVCFPLSAIAADTGAAVVHSNGGVRVNEAEVLSSISIFPGDIVETQPGFVANLDAEGSSVLIQPESLVRFEGSYLVLQHGSVEVGTSTSMSVHVTCMKVEPVTSQRTQYDVRESSGTIEVAALKNDVNVTRTGALQKTSKGNAISESATVKEGQQVKRHEFRCPAGQVPPAGNSFNMKWLEIGGATGGGVVALCLIFCRSSTPSSVSPSNP